jgi:hypothetical protein
MDSIRAAFSRFVNPKMLDEFDRNKRLTQPLKVSWLSCLILQVSDESAEDIRLHTEQAIPISLKYRGVILDMMGSLQFVAFGTHGDPFQESLKNSRLASEELMMSLGSKVRIVRLNGEITHGIIGNERFGYPSQPAMPRSCWARRHGIKSTQRISIRRRIAFVGARRICALSM